MTHGASSVYDTTTAVDSERDTTVYTTDVSVVNDWPDRIQNPDDYYVPDSDVSEFTTENEICLINSASGQTYGIN